MLTVTAKRVKTQYLAKENADYEARKGGERKVQKEGSEALTREVNDQVWAEAKRLSTKRLLKRESKTTNPHHVG